MQCNVCACLCVCLSITLLAVFSLAAEWHFMCWLTTVRKMVHPSNSNPKHSFRPYRWHMDTHRHAHTHTQTRTHAHTHAQIWHRQIKFLKVVFETSSMGLLSSHFEQILIQSVGHVQISHLKGNESRRNKFIKRYFIFTTEMQDSPLYLCHTLYTYTADGTISSH